MQLDADRLIDAQSVVGVDLFAGAGGFSLGAMLAGVDIMAAVEIDPKACATYRTNLIETGLSRASLFQTDIMHLKPQELLNRLGLEPGRCDILLGGPPCQGFSSHRLNGSGVGDPRNNLLLRYFEFVDVVRPKFFLVENVPGMLWPRHQQYVDSFYDMAEKIGYRLPPPYILNAGSYGVPQSRRRIFLLGTDRTASLECEWPPLPTHIAPNQEAPGETRPSWRPASVVFDRAAHTGDENDIHMRHNPELVAAFERTPINGGSRSESGRLLACHRSHDGHSDVYGRIDPSVPGPTMTTACINPSKGRFVHPTEAHGITLRQAARFQTFPDWYVFKGGLMAGGVQVGNAVPVDMARALLTPLARTAAASRGSISPTS